MKEVTSMSLRAPLIFCAVFFHLQAAEKVDAASDEHWLGLRPAAVRSR